MKCLTCVHFVLCENRAFLHFESHISFVLEIIHWEAQGDSWESQINGLEGGVYALGCLNPCLLFLGSSSDSQVAIHVNYSDPRFISSFGICFWFMRINVFPIGDSNGENLVLWFDHLLRSLLYGWSSGYHRKLGLLVLVCLFYCLLVSS